MNDVNLGILILRVLAGVTLSLHGINKFRSLKGTAGWFESIGMKPGRVNAIAAATTETAGGWALALGLVTPVAAAAVVGTMAVAGYVEHRKAFFVFKGGYEFTFILALIAVAVATVGPGEWSLDHAFGIDDNLNGVVGLLISAVGGLAGAAAHLALFYRPPARANAAA